MSNFVNNSPIGTLLSGDFVGFLLNVLYLLPALVIALSFHEAAHAFVADKMGDPTARNLGRLTLDPTKHVTLFGFLAFIFIGFGWGKPVPVNPRNYTNYKLGTFLVAIAGVTTNLLLSFIFFWVVVVLIAFGVHNEIALQIIYMIIYLNVILCFFNLIPIPPLDGHHLVKGFIAKRLPRFYNAYMQYGTYLLLALIFLPRFFGSNFSILGEYFKYTADFVMRGYSELLGLIF